MNLFQSLKQTLPTASPAASPAASPMASRITQLLESAADESNDASLSRRLWGGFLVLVGYLLSPLCWWNDLVINLPLALGFGYLFSWVYPEALVPLTIVGYWLSNVVGFVLMQQGTFAALQPKEQTSAGQSMRNGLITSTLYTLAIAALLQLHLLDAPDFLKGDTATQLTALLPDWMPF